VGCRESYRDVHSRRSWGKESGAIVKARLPGVKSSESRTKNDESVGGSRRTFTGPLGEIAVQLSKVYCNAPLRRHLEKLVDSACGLTGLWERRCFAVPRQVGTLRGAPAERCRNAVSPASRDRRPRKNAEVQYGLSRQFRLLWLAVSLKHPFLSRTLRKN